MNAPVVVVISGGVCQEVIIPGEPDRQYIVADFDDFDGGIDPGYWTERAQEIGEYLRLALGEDSEYYRDWMEEVEKATEEPPEASLVTGWDPLRGPTYE
jgi:hypothetical protein